MRNIFANPKNVVDYIGQSNGQCKMSKTGKMILNIVGNFYIK